MTNEAPSEVIRILLVEDNPADVALLQESLQEGRVPSTLDVVSDGAQAMDFLHRRGAFAGVLRPDLVLLDIGLPRKNGLEVLAEIKSDPVLRRIPVILLTTSRAEEDILRSYELHANSYITKPVHLDGFLQVVKAIEDFWFNVVKLPPRSDHEQRKD